MQKYIISKIDLRQIGIESARPTGGQICELSESTKETAILCDSARCARNGFNQVSSGSQLRHCRKESRRTSVPGQNSDPRFSWTYLIRSNAEGALCEKHASRIDQSTSRRSSANLPSIRNAGPRGSAPQRSEEDAEAARGGCGSSG